MAGTRSEATAPNWRDLRRIIHRIRSLRSIALIPRVSRSHDCARVAAGGVLPAAVGITAGAVRRAGGGGAALRPPLLVALLAGRQDGCARGRGRGNGRHGEARSHRSSPRRSSTRSLLSPPLPPFSAHTQPTATRSCPPSSRRRSSTTRRTTRPRPSRPSLRRSSTCVVDLAWRKPTPRPRVHRLRYT